MRKPSIGIAPEGLPIIFFLALAALTFAAFGCWPIAVILLLATWAGGHFFRDPERVVPAEPDIAVSPADGKVLKVEPAPEPLSGESRTRVSIFMCLCNVHVNRAPRAGAIERIQYYAGKFFKASFDKASTDNERCVYLLRDGDGNAWTIVQIAGLIARRIVCRAETGDTLAAGERFGLIRFGSRVDLYLPDAYSPQVAAGDKVRAGETIIARKSA
jgi:phosphatidylserine decarboxylase